MENNPHSMVNVLSPEMTEMKNHKITWKHGWKTVRLLWLMFCHLK
jgi:hypothetical protein